jgi:L-lactate dehydrogenase complex protein LldF
MTTPSIPFQDRTAQALADPALQSALERAVEHFNSGRSRAMGALPNADALRDHARRVRAHTLSRLDDYLTQFAEAVEATGGQVHWARDAVEANRIVCDLALSHYVKLAVKVKSMVTEEIGLNHALEAAGIRVVESDLGEYIIQLAGERPSHIVAPAVHKSKEQVGQLLHEKLGMPLTYAPEEMTAYARDELRRVFLSADMGISGVNFGVAETGTLCLVTNEGNGRLATTLPRLHVALMGIERLVPSLDDLSVMLQLLARSATGQKLTVYTNLLTGPRRPPAGAETAGEPDGPDELHVVLVDNGRSRVLGGDLAEVLYCIRCGACLAACPVYQHIGGHAYGAVYPGPIGSVLNPALYGGEEWSDLPHASSLCGACREVCPMRIDLPKLLLALRDAGVRAEGSPRWLRWGVYAYRTAAANPARFRLASRLASWGSRLLARSGWIRRLPPPLSAWTDHRDFPVFASKTFSQQWHERERIKRGQGPGTTS